MCQRPDASARGARAGMRHAAAIRAAPFFLWMQEKLMTSTSGIQDIRRGHKYWTAGPWENATLWPCAADVFGRCSSLLCAIVRLANGVKPTISWLAGHVNWLEARPLLSFPPLGASLENYSCYVGVGGSQKYSRLPNEKMTDFLLCNVNFRHTFFFLSFLLLFFLSSCFSFLPSLHLLFGLQTRNDLDMQLSKESSRSASPEFIWFIKELLSIYRKTVTSVCLFVRQRES